MDLYNLAQVNMGRLLAPINDPQIADFVAQLDAINLLAEQSTGFVWRLKSDSGNATDIAYNDDPLTIVNMSVWKSVETLKAFTYQSHHVEVLRNRKNWFEKMATPHTCLWWIPAGHIPTVAEARQRLDYFTVHGPTPYAFSFNDSFPPETAN